jgi:DNA-directed RNA polymerase specialized sigma24 family protein
VTREAKSGPEGFEAYVRARYADLRRLAFLLCDDWAAADDLVQTALIRCERRWPGVEPAARHAYVRQAVIRLTSTHRAAVGTTGLWTSCSPSAPSRRTPTSG